MKRVLLTGISGVGKSTVTNALAARGYKAVDADTAALSHWVEITDALQAALGSPVEATRDWVWREDRIAELLATADADLLFVSGCAANMGQFLPRFDHVILLSAPAAIIAERLHARTTNAYGKRPDEVARVLDLKASVEPALRRVAGAEIDTTTSLDAVLVAVLQVVQP